jgi:hypothetical protein
VSASIPFGTTNESDCFRRPPGAQEGIACSLRRRNDACCLSGTPFGLGFSLVQLKGSLHVRQAGGAPCLDVRATAARILAGVEQQIADLTQSRDALRALLGDWDDRLAGTPSGRLAHLLEALAASPARTRRSPVANLRRPGVRRA